MEIKRQKGVATTIVQPMVSSTSPEQTTSGLTVGKVAYYNDGAGWNSLSITDDFTEIGVTGEYSIDLTTAEANHDLMFIKMTAGGAADNTVLVYTGQGGDYLGIRNMIVEEEGSVTLQQAMSVVLAVCAGVSTGGGLTFQDPSGTSIRVQASVDNDSNRLTVIITPSA